MAEMHPNGDDDMPALTDEERGDLLAMGESLGIIGDLFIGGGATLPGLRMAVATIRRGADVLDSFAARWEKFDA